jgi:hypothetical protein
MHQTNPVATGCKAKCPKKMDKEGSKNRDNIEKAAIAW